MGWCEKDVTPVRWQWSYIFLALPRWQSLWDNMGPTWVLCVGPRWAPCCPHEPCYQGNPSICNAIESTVLVLKPEYLRRTRSMLIQASPGHHQSWYRQCRTMSPCLPRDRISSTFPISILRIDGKCKYIFLIFPKMNSARLRLIPKLVQNHV